MERTTQILTKEALLKHWLGHRALTRRVIEAFPEQDLFHFSLGGMRTFSALAQEMIAIAEPGLRAIVAREAIPYEEKTVLATKADLLRKWDEDAQAIASLYIQIPEEDFHVNFNLFGEYDFPIIENILYFIDNEVHHRGQGYVYLRALGIEPPFFWER